MNKTISKVFRVVAIPAMSLTLLAVQGCSTSPKPSNEERCTKSGGRYVVETRTRSVAERKAGVRKAHKDCSHYGGVARTECIKSNAYMSARG